MHGAVGRTRAAFYSRSGAGGIRRRRSMPYAGCVAISVTMVNAAVTRDALTPLLMARGRATLLGGDGRRGKH